MTTQSHFEPCFRGSNEPQFGQGHSGTTTLFWMSDPEAQGAVVWKRQIDEAAAGRYWRKFGLWYVGPTVVGALLALVLGGPGAMLGVLILLGGIGALIALMIWLFDKGRKANAEIRLVDGQLVDKTTAVRTSDVEAWTTHKSRVAGSRGPTAHVFFRVPVMRDGVRGVRPDGGPAFDLVRFPWPEMTAEELVGLRLALEPHLQAPWVPLEQLSA